ncbi:LOW QUALITY PROTEIN: hypothetical protein U9M48_002292 [Paspalum notatum var. saurae]|uniref:Leucine-rich repeat-containing N-terminal plant-type domain-containing protein n=1 Tax=Paspalum notatum var. saurae TaxID=547442 RepID=A0AAQ3PFV2_PASNO
MDATCIPREREALLAFKRGITYDPAGLLTSWDEAGDHHQDCCHWIGVRCSNTTGHDMTIPLYLLIITPLILLKLRSNSTSLLDEHCGRLSSNSVMSPYMRLHPVIKDSKLQWFLRFVVMINLALLSYSFEISRYWRYVIPSSARGSGPYNPVKARSRYLRCSSPFTHNRKTIFPHQPKTPMGHHIATMYPSPILLVILVAALTATNSFRIYTSEALPHHRAPGVDNHGAAGGACIPHEREALLAFKSGITYDPAGLLTSWDEAGDHHQDCCHWIGVRCSNTTGHVLKLLLGNENDDEDFPGLVGQISPSLTLLKHLEHLDLSMNELEGPTGRIPEFLGALTNLKYLDLSYINFVGSVPPQLGNLTKLQYLNVEQDGGLSSPDVSWLARLRSLQRLYLHGVHLSSAAGNWPHVVNEMPSLRYLDLSDCDLANANQTLPLFNLSNLEWLDLSHNNFLHTVASCWFWNITHLKHLDVREAGLYGQFPAAMMASLQFLDFSGNDGLVVANMSNMCDLEVLGLASCLLHADVANLFGILLHCTAGNRLQELHLSVNNISGVLPNWMGHLTSLTILSLDNNSITGPLPSFIGHFTSLRRLSLSYNRLTGHLPYEIGMLHSLTELYLDNNDMDGVITEEHFAGLKSLQNIDLSYNSLKIQISPEWQPPFQLKVVHFAACQMGPLFPAWMRWLTGTEYIDVSSAGIVDRFPDWFSNIFSHAGVINMSNNQIYGGLPKYMELMSSLGQLYLGSNQISGQIPPLPPNLTVLDLSMNSLSGHLPSNVGYINTLSLLVRRPTANLLPHGSPSQSPSSVFPRAFFRSGSFGPCWPPPPAAVAQRRVGGATTGPVEGLRHLLLAAAFFGGSSWLPTAPLEGPSPPGQLKSPLLPCSFKVQKPIWHYNITSDKLIDRSPVAFLDLFANVLTYLDMANNFIQGELPPCIWEMSLEFLNLSNNSLSSEFPWPERNYRSLVFLDLTRNNFSGAVPMKIGNLVGLHFLRLSHNKFSGEIPETITNLRCLQYLDIADNGLSGSFPRHLSNFTLMRLNYWAGRPQETWPCNLYDPPSVYHGASLLSGELPEDLGSLNGLQILNLSRNLLTGNVPSRIGSMKSLESLDLSRNMLSREIPTSLSNLTFLGYLDLSYNNLIGRIPSGTQLDTLYAYEPTMPLWGSS